MLILAEGRLSTRSRHCFRGNRTSNVPEQYASLLAPAPARLTTPAHPGVGTRVEIRRQAREAAHCRRKSTLDPHHRPDHTQARSIEIAILDNVLGLPERRPRRLQ